MGYQTWKQIVYLNLPQLEYLELWFKEEYNIQRKIEIYNEVFNLNILEPFLADDSFLNFKYLGLCICEWADDLVDFLKDSPITKGLSILNLNRGTLIDKGAEILLNCPTLNVSIILLSSEMVNKLSQLHCNVIAKPQDHLDYSLDSCGYERYCALYK